MRVSATSKEDQERVLGVRLNGEPLMLGSVVEADDEGGWVHVIVMDERGVPLLDDAGLVREIKRGAVEFVLNECPSAAATGEDLPFRAEEHIDALNDLSRILSGAWMRYRTLSDAELRDGSTAAFRAAEFVRECVAPGALLPSDDAGAA